MTELSMLKKHLVAYGLFQVLALSVWLLTAWVDPIAFLSSYLPILPLWVLIATIRNYRRIQHDKKVAILPYTCYIWVTVVMSLFFVLDGLFLSFFGAVFRIVWTWKLRRKLRDYRHSLTTE